MRMNTEGLLEKIRSVKDETADGKNRLPDRKVIVYILKETQVILMPEYFHFSACRSAEIRYICPAEHIRTHLNTYYNQT